MSDLKRFDAKVDGDKVIVSFNQRMYLVLGHQAAAEVGKALIQCAKRAEEHAQAAQIIADSAILMRAGVPFSLSNNPKILAEAAKEAAWNRTLRRFMPGGVLSEEVVGTPTLIKEKC